MPAKDAFLGQPPKSRARQFDARDLWGTVRDVLIFGASELAVQILEAVDAVDFGEYDQSIALVLAAVIVGLRRWAKDYQPPPEVPN